MAAVDEDCTAASLALALAALGIVDVFELSDDACQRWCCFARHL